MRWVGVAVVSTASCVALELGGQRRPMTTATPTRRVLLGGGAASVTLGRRPVGGVAGALAPLPSAAAELRTASWSATDGFDSDFPAPISFIEFDEKAYKAMRDDPRRTPKFAKAIAARLAGKEGQLTVLDLGTGPYCVLALIAVKYGAKKVYAIEANPEAARRARDFVRRCEAGDRGMVGYYPLVQGQVEIIEGFSTEVDLPERVDVVVAEICGSVASEEGLYATMRDARERHVKLPDDPSSWIPRRCQTFGAPMTYALQSLLTAPAFDWSKALDAPIRFNCRDEALQLLAPPQLFEDIDFSKPLPASGTVQLSQVAFTLDAKNLQAAEARVLQALRDERQLKSLLQPGDDPAAVARAVAAAFSGVALWPALVLDETITVRSRGEFGEAQKSHWQTVLELMTVDPVPVRPGDRITVALNVKLPSQVSTALNYQLKGAIQPQE